MFSIDWDRRRSPSPTGEMTEGEEEYKRVSGERPVKMLLSINWKRKAAHASPRSPPLPALPLELWVEIFVHTLPSSFPIPSPVVAPLLLCQVCRAWRKLALSTPALWRSIAIEHWNDAVRQSQAKLITTWFARASVLPLSLSFHSPGTVNPRDLTDLFSNYAARLQCISINLPFLSMKGLNLPGLTFPNLEQLSISLLPDGAVPPSSSKIRVFNASPRLRSVRVESIRRGLDIRVFDLPFESLTHITSDALFSINDCLTLLSQCDALVYCSLQGVLDSSPLSLTNIKYDPSNRLTLRHLRTLEITTSQNLGPALGLLSFPALTSLTISYYLARGHLGRRQSSTPPPWSATSLVSFVTRSMSLTTLALHRVPINEVDVVECLRRVPRLTRLHLTSVPRYAELATERVLQVLGGGAGIGPIVQHLEELKIVGGQAFGDRVLVDMVEKRVRTQRSGTGMRLRRLELDLFRQLEPNVLARLEALSNDGLELIVGS